ncbi:MAG TPA: SurA N-terminal domain-containing protein [Micromonosporaceae bacterium]|nr:SurA N-terminal domain-containing protein [Micromonosporaceae bacterium]
MTTRRRVLAVAAAGALAVAGLAGCRSDPGVAAYVGPEKITERQVDQVVKSVTDLIPEGRTAAVREQVVEMLVMREAVNQYAKAQRIAIPAADVAGYAEQNQIPAGPDGQPRAYTTLAAQFDAAFQAIQGKVTPTAPSAKDQREVYDNARIDGKPVTQAFEDVQQYFSMETIGGAVGVRNLLVGVVAGADVAVNPRYAPLVYQVPAQVGQVPSWLGVPLGDPGAESVVIDRA